MDPITRKEKFYDAILTGDTSGLPDPITREEIYLKAIAENGGGGGGGTTNYNALSNKPQINSIELTGNKSLNDLNIQKKLTAGENIEIEADGTINAIGGGADPVLATDLTASVEVGGVSVGETFEEGDTLESVLREILAPTLFPTFTAPSASMSATGAKLLEKGATLATVFTIVFNRGSITPAYGTSGFRSGVAMGYSLNDGESQSGNTFNVTVSEAQKTYQGSVAYAAGEQPKDSNGGDYDSPLPAGSVDTNTISYEFVEAMWANTAAIGTIAKLALVSKGAKQRDMVFPAQTIANPEVFDIPASWTVTAVQVKNDLSGAFDDASEQFTVTDVSHDDASGTSVAYKRYTFNMGFDTGARTVRVKWN